MSAGDEETRSLVDRRSVLRFAGVAAAGAAAAGLGVAACDSGSAKPPAEPTTFPPKTFPPTTTGAGDALAGMTVPPRALERWMSSHQPVLNIACIGDSLTQGTIGLSDYEHGGSGSWVERLATATGRAIGPNIGYGFRALWLGVDANTDHEWKAVGAWKSTTPLQEFDVCLFGDGFSSSGGAEAVLTWTKPPGVTVAGFDLYWFGMAGAGNWQYRVDNGEWTNMGQALGSPDNKLHKFYVPRAINTNVQIRAYDGHAACITPIGGISIYSQDPRGASGLIVHNLGRDEDFLSIFVRESAGDPLAWLDAVVSNPPELKMRPALVTVMFSNDAALNLPTEGWKSNLVTLISRVRPYADVLLMNPCEQSTRDATVQANFRAATASVAKEQGCGLLDLYDAWSAAGDTGWSAANKDGLMLDALHPSQRGHNDIAARVWRLLRTFS